MRSPARRRRRVAELAALVAGGEIRLLDLLVVSRGVDGDLSSVEIEDLGLGELELEASGIVGDDDLAELGEVIAPGTSAALLAIELVWAKRLASRFAESGGVVLRSDRIPADVVNTVLEAAVN